MLRWVLSLIAAYLLTCVQTIALAQSPAITLDGPVQPPALVGHIDYYLDADWSRTVGGMLGEDKERFQPFDGAVPNFGYTKSMVWLRLRARNGTPGIEQWRVYFHENFKQIFEVHVARQDGSVETRLVQNPGLGFYSRPIPYPELVAPIEIEPNEEVTILVKFWSEGSSELGFSLETVNSFAAVSAARTAKNFLFYGMTMLLIIFALVSLLIFRHVVFAAYIAYALSVLLFLMHGDGVTFQYLWPNAPIFNGSASILAGSAIIISGANYARVFLQTKRFHPLMDKLLLAAIAVTLAIDAAALFADNQVIKKTLILVALFSIALFAISGLVAARSRFKQVRFYVIAWIGAVLSSLIMTARHWLDIDLSQDFEYDSMRVVMVFDAAMMGLAIADRYNQLRQSRQAAMAASLQEANRNLELNNRLLELEERYSLATELAKSRDEEMQNTVHDLRQPLHALRLNVRNLASGGNGDNVDHHAIDATFTYLEELVSSHLQTGKAELPLPSAHHDERTSADLGIQDVLQGIHEMFAPDAREKGIELRLIPTSLESDVEPLTLMRIVSNLVSNAIKYTTKGGVLIGTRRSGNRVQVEVHDTGAGMSAEEFELAQKRDVRLETGERLAEGKGYGLSIARQLAIENGLELRLAKYRKSGSGVILSIPFAGPRIPPSVTKSPIVPETAYPVPPKPAGAGSTI